MSKRWHARATVMRAEGWKLIAIAAHFGKSIGAVQFATSWEERTKHRVRQQFWRQAKRDERARQVFD